jgi:imidazolonepropionase-like amidohydrolase
VAGTWRAAELLGLADRIGVVKPGYFVDLLVVRGDPVSSIMATRSVALVIKSGRIVYTEDPSLPPPGF